MSNISLKLGKNIQVKPVGIVTISWYDGINVQRLKRYLLNDEKCVCECGKQNCSECSCHACMIEKCVGDIVNEVGESQSLISHQLIVLRKANLVRTRKEGQKVYYSLSDSHVKELLNVAVEHVEEL